MTTSEKIKGKSLILSLGDPAVDYKCDMKSAVLENEELDGDGYTFCDAENDTQQWFFTITALQSTQTTSFWRMLWANTGEDVDYVFSPHGNAVATTDKPIFRGTVHIGKKPNIGGEANTTYTFEYRLDCNEEPELDDGSTSS